MKKLLKVLIADDEDWLLKGMCKIIPWEENGFTVVATARDGLSAVALAQSYQVDIAFLDIRMPGLNGLETLKEIKKMQPETQIVMISGYAEFAYAQKAVKFGASDYLLKPVDATELLRCVNRLKELQATHISNTEMMMRMTDIADNDRIREIMKTKGIAEDSRKILICFNQIALAVKPPLQTVIFDVGETCVWLTCVTPLEEKVLLHNCNGLGAVGVSDGFYNFDSFQHAWRQACLAGKTFWSEQCGVFHENSERDFEALQFVNQLWKLYSERNIDYFFVVFDKLALVLCSRHVGFRKTIVLYNNLITMLKGLCGVDTCAIEYLSEEDILKNEPDGASFSALLLQLGKKLRTQLSCGKDKSEQNAKGLVDEIVQYIDEHFCDIDLTVEKIAAHFYISPAYFGQIFKKPMGLSITEYINRKRCNCAEYLMINMGLSVKEASAHVGIQDYFYFNKLYKKYKQVTPGKVRRERGEHNDM